MLDEMLRQLRYDEADGGQPNLTVYDDATGRAIVPGTYVQGHPTIGIGLALDTRGITSAQAETLFEAAVASTEAAMPDAVPEWTRLDAVRRDALTNMGFEMGAHGVGEFLTMRGHLREAIASVAAGDTAGAWDAFHAAAVAALDSAWARELARFGSLRARRVAAQLATGDAQAAPLPIGLVA